jgi:hypothetical protein
MKLELRKPLKSGIYPAVVIEVKPAETKFGAQLVWRFRLEDEGGHTVRSFSSTAYTPKSKLARWVQACLGELPEELDTNRLAGTACRVELDAEGEYPRVREVLPPEGLFD